MSRDITQVIIHHTAADRPHPQVPAIEEWHKARGFPLSSLGTHIGYHYVIEMDGTVVQTRQESEVGAHDQGENLDSIGIGLAGNFNVTVPSNEQCAALRSLLADIGERYRLGYAAFVPHRKNDQTDCYGTRLDDWWAARLYLEGTIARLQKLIAELKNMPT
ncbi:N-acetylmuramoyl-L-alanine amidase [Candidatus Wolfebacteria bacterium]|nr:N-acetylmuramoyl-L-alanine amidase [Candidatus Wolfebacteria bacterium]